MKVLIQTSKSVSLSEVARQIAYVGEKLGHVIILNRSYPSRDTIFSIAKALVLIYPPSPAYCMHWFLIYREAKKELNGRVVYYTTIEGKPKRLAFPQWVFRDVEFIANSHYTAKMLQSIGLKVKDIIHHGILSEEVKLASYYARKYENIIKSKFKNRVVFGTVSDLLPRKGLDKLIEATKMLLKKRQDFVVLLITKKDIMPHIQTIPNMFMVCEFGSRDHTEIMGFYGAIDYLIHPALAEGFGLPVLEAMAMGTPVIHAWYEPLSEFSHKDANLTFPPSLIRYVDTQEGILYEFHEYDPEDLAEMMEKAIDIKLKHKDEYEDRKAKVKEQAMKFKSEELYKRIYQHLGV